MTRLRFTLAQLMAIVLFIGFGFAALRNADDFWSSASLTLAILSISAALVGAIVRDGRRRTTWIGFAVFGWTYVLVGFLPPQDIRFPTVSDSIILNPRPLIEWGLERVMPLINPHPSRVQVFVHAHYVSISHSLGIILSGLVGAVLGHFLAVKNERPSP